MKDKLSTYLLAGALTVAVTYGLLLLIDIWVDILSATTHLKLAMSVGIMVTIFLAVYFFRAEYITVRQKKKKRLIN